LFGAGDDLAITYHGGGSGIQDAVKLRIESNSELTDIDIDLPDTTLHTISGSVIAKSDHIPLPGATVSIRIKDRAGWFSPDKQGLQTDSQGQWKIEGVPDGAYSIRVEPPTNIPIPGSRPTPANEEMGMPEQFPTRKFVSTEAVATVAGGDVVVGTIELPEGASISGTVEYPQATEEVPGEYRYVQVVWRYEGEFASEFGNSTGAYAGDFSIHGLREGKLYLSAQIGYPAFGEVEASKYYIKSITLNGADLMQKPITIREGQSITGVRVVVAEGMAKASVKVTHAEGKPVTARRVAFVPVDSSRWSFSREILTGITDSRGLATFSCAPGEYLVIVAKPEDSWPPPPGVIGERSSGATRIKVKSGDDNMVTVTLAP
jgi:hypothetical protein